MYKHPDLKRDIFNIGYCKITEITMPYYISSIPENFAIDVEFNTNDDYTYIYDNEKDAWDDYRLLKKMQYSLCRT